MTSDNQLEVQSAIGSEPDPETGGQMTFFEHLVELRKRIINSGLAVADRRDDRMVCCSAVRNFIIVPIQTRSASARPGSNWCTPGQPTI